MMLLASLDEHANDDAEEPGYFWHGLEDTKVVPSAA
jgi:hypothetical protein